MDQRASFSRLRISISLPATGAGANGPDQIDDVDAADDIIVGACAQSHREPPYFVAVSEGRLVWATSSNPLCSFGRICFGRTLQLLRKLFPRLLQVAEAFEEYNGGDLLEVEIGSFVKIGSFCTTLYPGDQADGPLFGSICRRR